MTKKITITWDVVENADGYFVYMSLHSNPLESLGAAIDNYSILHNREDGQIVNFGVQAFQLQVVNGFERRVFGPVAVVQVDVSNASEQVIAGTAIASVVVEEE